MSQKNVICKVRKLWNQLLLVNKTKENKFRVITDRVSIIRVDTSSSIESVKLPCLVTVWKLTRLMTKGSNLHFQLKGTSPPDWQVGSKVFEVLLTPCSLISTVLTAEKKFFFGTTKTILLALPKKCIHNIVGFSRGYWRHCSVRIWLDRRRYGFIAQSRNVLKSEYVIKIALQIEATVANNYQTAN